MAVQNATARRRCLGHSICPRLFDYHSSRLRIAVQCFFRCRRDRPSYISLVIYSSSRDIAVHHAGYIVCLMFSVITSIRSTAFYVVLACLVLQLRCGLFILEDHSALTPHHTLSLTRPALQPCSRNFEHATLTLLHTLRRTPIIISVGVPYTCRAPCTVVTAVGTPGGCRKIRDDCGGETR
jgi:hypothetical protein